MKGKTTFLAKAFMMLFAVLFSLTGARAETLTVYEDATGSSNYVPVYGLWADSYLKCEFVIADTELAAMPSGSTITQMAFYATSAPSEAWNGTFQVFLKEVSGTTLDAYYGPDDDEVAYEGSLDASSGTMTIEFSSPYVYQGGNLLVGVYLVAPSNYKSASFKGATVEGACIQNYSASNLDAVAATQRNFVPTTTFTYTPGSGVVYEKPTALTVSDLTENSATISWTEPESKVDGYAYQYKKATEEWGEDLTTTDASVELTGLEQGTTYNFRVKALYGEEASAYAIINFSTEWGALSLPYFEDFEGGIGAWTLANCVSGTGVTSAIGYDGTTGFKFSYSTNPPQYLISPKFDGASAMNVTFWYKNNSANFTEIFQVGYSTTTNDVDAFTWGTEVSKNDTQWEQYETDFPVGTKYVAIKLNSNDQFNLYLDNFEFTVASSVAKPTDLAVSEVAAKSAKLSWTENGTATAWEVCVNGDEENLVPANINPFVLTVTPETAYTVKVRAINNGESSKWSNEVSFTTPEEFPRPTDVAVEAGASSATVTWEGGNADSYNVRYKKVSGFFEDFESCTDGNLPEGWTTIDADGDGNDWFIWYPAASGYSTTDGNNNYTVFDQVGVTSASYAQSALTPDNWLISPQIDLEGTLSVWMRGQDPGWAGEVFAIYVSTTGTEVADFSELIGETTATGVMTEYTADLSTYAGQSGYIAIRHFNVTDMFRLNLDNFRIIPTVEEEWITLSTTENSVELTELDSETTYEVEVQSVYGEDLSAWTAKYFTTLNSNPVPYNVAVTPLHNSATIEWKGDSESYEVKYRTAAKLSDTPTFFEDFEDLEEGALPEGWTTIDNDGDGNTWSTHTNTGSGNYTTYSGDGLAYSASYDNNSSSALTPDNWLITPKISLGGGVGVWMRAQDSSWSDEHVALYVSTEATIADVSSFVEIMPETVVTGEYVQYTADLTAYEGQEGYIAIRHFNCTDMFVLNVDDFGVYPAAPAGEWITITTTDTSVELTGLDMDTEYEYMITGIKEGSPDASTEIASFTTLNENDKIFATDGDWDLASNWIPEGVPTATDKVTIKANAIIQPNVAAEASEITIDGGSLTIKDGGYLTHYNSGVVATVEKNIEANKYYLVSAPLYLFDSDDNQTPLDPADVEGMLTGDYDLYDFDFTKAGEEWRNYKAEPFYMYQGYSYLYANSEDVTLKFTGELVPATQSGSGYVAYAAGPYFTSYTTDTTLPWANWILGGNPHVDYAALTLGNYDSTTGLGLADHQYFYTMNDDAVVALGEDAYATVEPTEGLFYISQGSSNVLLSSSDVFANNESVEDPVMAVPAHGLTTHQDATPAVIYELADMDEGTDNEILIEELDGSIVNIMLAGRTLLKDNTWNTICLPFALDEDQIAASPLAGADIRTLESVVDNGSNVILNFTAEGAISEIEAGKPYIIKWTSGENIESPVFEDVTIEYVNTPIACDVTGSEAAATITFKGTYNLIMFDEDVTSVLFVKDNQFCYPLAGARIGACRGFFDLEGISAGEGNGAKQFIMNFGDDATGIATISNADGEENWYDLSGRKVGKLNQKGIYVTEGRKVTVK